MTRDELDADLLKAVRHAARMRQAFYILVLVVALVGQVTGAVQTLDIPTLIAIPAVIALELGGVVVMTNADVRRRLGEQAIASRLLSAAIAAGAATFNWAAHPNHLHGGFYAGMSTLGYVVWLMHAGNQRRDRRRAVGDLPPSPPTYDVLEHWIRHPLVTSRARSLAKSDGLDLYESLKAARAAIGRERRDAAISTVLHRKIRATTDPATADIAVRVYDLDEIAARLAAIADYDGLTALLAADLAPNRIITNSDADQRRHSRRRKRFSSARRTPASISTSPDVPAHDAVSTPEAKRQPGPRHDPEPMLTGNPPQLAAAHDPDPPQALPPLDEPADTDRPREAEANQDVSRDDRDENTDEPAPASTDPDDDLRVPTATAEAVAYWLRKEPNLDPELLAQRIGKSLRSVYRYLPPSYPRRPGVARKRTRPGTTRRSDQNT
ncbi:hypothetical protein [Micromonospora musae]|uniref:hypothetical protein n=1 Tax=Micromonospora musae TaxID=1894970 RepID=UPI00343B500C